MTFWLSAFWQTTKKATKDNKTNTFFIAIFFFDKTRKTFKTAFSMKSRQLALFLRRGSCRAASK
jgi:hypothetical protein